MVHGALEVWLQEGLSWISFRCAEVGDELRLRRDHPRRTNEVGRSDIPRLVVQSGRSAGWLNTLPGFDWSRYPQIMAAPPVARPAEFFALTRILLVPSAVEAFGRVAAEAMINGIPPVVSDPGGLPDTVGGDFAAGGGRVLPLPEWMTGTNDRLPSEDEARPWFEAVCSLWDDQDFYERMAARAREIAAERYSEGVSRDERQCGAKPCPERWPHVHFPLKSLRALRHVHLGSSMRNKTCGKQLGPRIPLCGLDRRVED